MMFTNIMTNRWMQNHLYCFLRNIQYNSFTDDGGICIKNMPTNMNTVRNHIFITIKFTSEGFYTHTINSVVFLMLTHYIYLALYLLPAKITLYVSCLVPTTIIFVQFSWWHNSWSFQLSKLSCQILDIHAKSNTGIKIYLRMSKVQSNFMSDRLN